MVSPPIKTIHAGLSRLGLCALVASLALGASCSNPGEIPDAIPDRVPPAIERPNIVLLSLDTLRADFLGCYGQDLETTPAIDQIAAAGTRFTDTTSASPWTLPSHASLFSGLYPSRHGVTDKEFRLTAPSLPTLLQSAGYQTMGVSNALLVGHPHFNLMTGFDLNRHIPEFGIRKRRNGTERVTRGTLNAAGIVVDQAQDWLRGRDTTKPFFMFLHFYDAHTDLNPDPVWREKFVGPYDGELNGRTMQLLRSREPGRGLSQDDAQWLREMYAAEIRTLDEHLKRLFAFLDDQNLTETTVVVVTSDHGEEFLDHGGVLHGVTHYQELLHIPLIMRGPGIPIGKRVKFPTHLIDVAPTLLRLSGVEHPAMDGVDLATSWLEPIKVPAQRFLFSEADHNNPEGNNIHRMVRLGQHKLHYDTLTGRKQLYALDDDPREQNDLVHTQPQLVGQLWTELERFMSGKSVGFEASGLDDEELEGLKALGYMGTDDD
ncbi:MAG: arylsulfatase A-like enzyme [Hyphomicrobiaceae bacterium]|jgi:arylsulfatase A-like enzyme